MEEKRSYLGPYFIQRALILKQEVITAKISLCLQLAKESQDGVQATATVAQLKNDCCLFEKICMKYAKRLLHWVFSE